MRKDYPAKSEAESARANAQKYGYLAIVRYKYYGAPDLPHAGVSRTGLEIRNYMTSPLCCDVEFIYDGRPIAQVTRLRPDNSCVLE